MKKFIEVYEKAVVYDYLIDAFYNDNCCDLETIFKDDWRFVWENYHTMSASQLRYFSAFFDVWVKSTFSEVYPEDSSEMEYPFKLDPEIFFSKFLKYYDLQDTIALKDAAKIINILSHAFYFTSCNYYSEDCDANRYYHAAMMTKQFADIVKKDLKEGVIIKAIPDAVRHEFATDDKVAAEQYKWVYYKALADDFDKLEQTKEIKSF